MLGDIGAMMKLLGSRDKIQAAVQKFQERLPDVTAEAEAGGGLVRVRANGRMEILACTIRPDAMTLSDPTMLAEVVVAATNAALAQVRLKVAEATQAMAGEVGLPPQVMKQFGGLLGAG